MEKIIDILAYKIEKSLKEEGFTGKVDNERKVKLLIKIKSEELR